jgi:hypothetical protein
VSRDASITLTWADGDYVFRLGYGELMQLQEACDAGPMWILSRLQMPTAENRGWRVQDVAHVLRLGLIGGGLDPIKALRLVREYVEARPPMESLRHAQAVLSAALVGAPEEAQKKSAKGVRSGTASGESGASAKPSERAQ